MTSPNHKNYSLAISKDKLFHIKTFYTKKLFKVTLSLIKAALLVVLTSDKYPNTNFATNSFLQRHWNHKLLLLRDAASTTLQKHIHTNVEVATTMSQSHISTSNPYQNYKTHIWQTEFWLNWMSRDVLQHLLLLLESPKNHHRTSYTIRVLKHAGKIISCITALVTHLSRTPPSQDKYRGIYEVFFHLHNL